MIVQYLGSADIGTPDYHRIGSLAGVKAVVSYIRYHMITMIT